MLIQTPRFATPIAYQTGSAHPVQNQAVQKTPDRSMPPSLRFQSIAPGDHLEFAADGFLDRNDGPRLEYESRKHRAEFVNGQRVVTVHQHVPTPLPHSHHEEFDLEV